MKKNILVFIIVLITIFCNNNKVYALNLESNSAIAIDAKTNRIIFEKNIEKKSFPASTTKIMTAIILMEHLRDSDLIEISEKASNTEASNSQVLFEPGEEITKLDALAMIMMVSANDVSNAIAEAISGSNEEFSKLMNEKAKEYGLKNTNFKNPSGLTDEEHLTTVYDMAIITKEAMKYPEIVEAMQMDTYELKTNKRNVVVEKTHTILENNNSTIGGKTGWIPDAKYTLSVVAKDGDKEVVAVVFGADSREQSYIETNKMIEQSFKKLKAKKLFKAGEKVLTLSSGEKNIKLFAKEDIVITTIGDEKVQGKVELKELKNFKPKEEVGYLTITLGGGEEVSFPLVTQKRIIEDNPLEESESVFKQFWLEIVEKNSVKKSSFIILIPSLFVMIALFFGSIFTGRV